MINNLSSFGGNWQQGGIHGQRPPFPPPQRDGQGVENSQQLPPPPPPEFFQNQNQGCSGCSGQQNPLESLLNQFGSQSYLGQSSNTLGNFLQF